jgi:hypothetical protein
MIHCSTPNPLPPTYNIYLKKFKTLDSRMRTRAWNKKQRLNSDEIPVLYQEERQLQSELSSYTFGDVPLLTISPWIAFIENSSRTIVGLVAIYILVLVLSSLTIDYDAV